MIMSAPTTLYRTENSIPRGTWQRASSLAEPADHPDHLDPVQAHQAQIQARKPISGHTHDNQRPRAQNRPPQREFALATAEGEVGRALIGPNLGPKPRSG
jgi:hypothetical protein